MPSLNAEKSNRDAFGENQGGMESMAIEAPLSSYKKKNMIFIACLLIGAGLWFYYDGYHKQEFIEKHTIDGKIDSTLNFPQKNRRRFLLVREFFTVYLFIIKGKKIIADEEAIKTRQRNDCCTTVLKKLTKRILTARGILSSRIPTAAVKAKTSKSATGRMTICRRCWIILSLKSS